MSEEKKKILAQIDELPEVDKAYIIGFAAGVTSKIEEAKNQAKSA